MIDLVLETLLQAYPLYLFSLPIMLISVWINRYYRSKNLSSKKPFEPLAIIVIVATIDVILAATCYSNDFLLYFDINNLKKFNNIHFEPINFFNNILLPSLMGDLHALINLFGNMMLFVPLGFCAMWLNFGKKQLKIKITIICFFFSIMIEIIQMSYGRMVDCIDIILNTSGAILGCWLFVYFMALTNNLSEKFPAYKEH